MNLLVSEFERCNGRGIKLAVSDTAYLGIECSVWNIRRRVTMVKEVL